MIDKTEIECRFRRSVDSYEDNATVQKWIVQRLVELLQEYVPYSSRTLEIGCGTGLLSEKINRLWEDQQFWVNDLVEQMCRKTIDRCQLPVSHGLNGDIEQIPLTGKFDLIVSASTFQWLAHPRATFAKLAAHLNTNGWLIFSTFGKNNFKELKAVTGQGLVVFRIRYIVYRRADTYAKIFRSPGYSSACKENRSECNQSTDSLDQRTSSRVL